MNESTNNQRELLAEVAALRKRVEDLESVRSQLRNSEALRHTITEHSPDHIMLLDPSGTILYINRTVPDLTIEQVLGTRVFAYVAERFHPAMRDCFARVVESGKTDSYDVEYQPEGGSLSYFESQVSAVQHHDELRLIVSSRNVTQRRRTEHALRRSEELYRLVIECVPGGIARVTTDGAVLDANPEARRLLGLDQAEVAITHWHQRTFWEDGRPCAVSDYPVTRCLATGKTEGPDTIGVEHEDGSITWAVFRAAPLTAPASGAVVTILDITERRKADEEIRRQKTLLEAIFRAVPDAVFLTDESGQISMCNPGLTRLFGYQPEEVVGRDGTLFFDRTADLSLPPDTDESEEPAPRALTCRRKDGERFPGETIRTVVRSRAGARLGELWLIRDISQRVAAEQARQRTQKLESLSVLAGGVAHDFNNLLVGILGNASLVLNEIDSQSPARSRIVSIEQAARRAAELTDQLLAYSGRGRLARRPFELSSTLRDMKSLLETAVSDRVTIRYQLATGLPVLRGDPSQLAQVVMSLLTNASDAYAGRGGTITLTTGLVEADRDYLSAVPTTPPIQPGSYVFLEVTDEGCGMSPETMARVYDPFFTTKFAGRGLGMAAVVGIVRAHGGGVRVESAEGRGTRFSVLLPAATSDEVPAARATARPDSWQGKGLVLIVDDDDGVREVTAAALGQLGFEVIEATDGEEGIEAFVAHRADIRLILLDLTMPRLDGEETLRRLRSLQAEAPVILMSGYAEQDLERLHLDLKVAGFLHKPYRLTELTACVRSVLEG